MSVKKEYETKTQTVTEKILVKETRFCDVCNKVIGNKNGYWKLTTHHNDWGNDSYESVEKFDVCSAKCLVTKFDEYLKSSEKGYNTQCFEVERKG